MEYSKDFTRLDSYTACVKQALDLPSWMSEITDHLGKNYEPKSRTLDYILNLARLDKTLSIKDLSTLIAYVEGLRFS